MKKRILCLLLMAVVLLSSCAPTINYMVLEEEEITYYAAAHVGKALKNPWMIGRKDLLEKVTLESSMGIELPRVDAGKILIDGETLIAENKNQEAYTANLKEHHIDEEAIAGMTLVEYYSLKDGWPLDAERQKNLSLLYPDLRDEDLSAWTVADEAEFTEGKTLEAKKKKLTEGQLQDLTARGVQEWDLEFLLQEYRPAKLTRLTDEEIRTFLEQKYASELDRLFGEGTAEKLK